MPDDSDMKQEETGPVAILFEDVVKDNLEEAAIQKKKYVMGMVEPCMNRVEKRILEN